MAIIERKYQIDVNHVGKSNLLSNHGILSLLESIACYHSEMVGYGINHIEKTKLTWVLLHWKVKVFKRLPYGSFVNVKTWAHACNKFFTLRDFEIYDEAGNLVCIASSKWTLIDLNTSHIAKITPEIIGVYEPEAKSVFGENDIKKLTIPQTFDIPDYIFKVLRRDIDVNGHMHNTYYLDYAYEALPLNVYELKEATVFEIMYKSGAKLGDSVSCHYIQKDGYNIIMKNISKNQLHAIVKLL